MQNRKLIACKLDTYFFLHSHCPSDPEPLWSGLSFCREAHTKEKRERRRKGMAAGMQSNGTAVRGEPQTQKQTEIRGEGNVRSQAVAQKHTPADTDMDRAVPDMTSRGHSETIPDVSPGRHVRYDSHNDSGDGRGCHSEAPPKQPGLFGKGFRTPFPKAGKPGEASGTENKSGRRGAEIE